MHSSRTGVFAMTNSRFSRLSVFLTLVMLASVASAQTLSVLYNFGSASGDPLNPAYIGAVTQGQDGNLYSTTPFAAGLYSRLRPQETSAHSTTTLGVLMEASRKAA